MHPNQDPFFIFPGGAPSWGEDQAWHFDYRSAHEQRQQHAHYFRNQYPNPNPNAHPHSPPFGRAGGLFDDLRDAFRDFADAAQNTNLILRAQILMDPTTDWDDIAKGEDSEYMFAEDIICTLAPTDRCGDRDVYLITSLPSLSDSKEMTLA